LQKLVQVVVPQLVRLLGSDEFRSVVCTNFVLKSFRPKCIFITITHRVNIMSPFRPEFSDKISIKYKWTNLTLKTVEEFIPP
jgi:hypothetical protein